MAGDTRQPGAGGEGGVFGSLDPKLTIYALANGMDLVKSGTARSLEWYRDGMDRGILLEAGDDGKVSVTSRAWRTSAPDAARSIPQGEAVAPEALLAGLSDILQRALDAANRL
ncbi:MAG: hypothetical protein PVJ02_10745 [Gemmatimonadota bacterium]|jgi:hypothetical protein